jgi:hypothetical protein
MAALPEWSVEPASADWALRKLLLSLKGPAHRTQIAVSGGHRPALLGIRSWSNENFARSRKSSGSSNIADAIAGGHFADDLRNPVMNPYARRIARKTDQ